MDNNLQDTLNFILELDKQKEIMRQTYLASGVRKENDAEHGWHLAVMAVLLADYANEKIDILRTVKMVLLHDIIEIDAGDTYAYDTSGNETKIQREQIAADRLYGLLPEGQRDEYLSIWEEFEAMETPEAKFANTLDKIQPVLLTNAQGGLSWREHQVTKSQIMKRNSRTAEGSQILWQVIEEMIYSNLEKENLIDDEGQGAENGI
ncbi:MAG: HD domain-containing protein [Lachnospiraceae bacterium]